MIEKIILQITLEKQIDDEQGKVTKTNTKWKFVLDADISMEDMEERINQWGKQLDNQTLITDYIEKKK